MAAETLSCPYCNSSVTLVRPAGVGQRLRCPRCHELFPYRGRQEGTQAPDNALLLDTPDEMEPFGQRPAGQPRSWSNRAVALVILSIMIAMAAIGFAFAWFTTESRRQRDRLGETSAAEAPRVVSIAPAKLTALGYLPNGIEAIAGIHVAELMNQPRTAAVLRLIRSDQVNFAIYRLEQLIGLPLEELDHIVIGLKMIEAELVPHIYLIVQTRRPYGREAIREKLNAKRGNSLSGKLVYRISSEQIQPGAALWCAGERTLVFALQPKDLAELPGKPIPGVDRFAPQLQKYLTAANLAAGTQAWAVGASSRWNEILDLLQLVGLADADQSALSQVRNFSVQVHCVGTPNGSVDARLEAECADPAGALKFANYLAAKGLDRRRLGELAQQRPWAAALFGELARSLRPQQTARHVVVQLNATIESIRQALEGRAAQ